MAEPHLRYPMGRGEAAMMVPRTTGCFSLDKNQHSANCQPLVNVFFLIKHVKEHFGSVIWGIYLLDGIES